MNNQKKKNILKKKIHLELQNQQKEKDLKKKNSLQTKKDKDKKTNINQSEKQKKNQKKNQKKKAVIPIVASMLLVFSLVFGVSYGFFTTTTRAKEFVMYTGTLAVSYQATNNTINLDKLYPMTDAEGLTQNSHSFTVNNNGNIDARYQIRLELDETEKNMIPLEYVKLSYKKNTDEFSEPILLSNLDSSLAFIRNEILESNHSDTYEIKLWIDLGAPNEIQGKTFSARVVVDSIQNVDDGYVVDTAPIITLKKDKDGNQDIHLKVGEKYTELGVAEIKDDQEIFTNENVITSYEHVNGDEIESVNTINTEQPGIYYVNYEVTDKSKNKGTATRVVVINKTDIVPTIALKGEKVITIEETENYVDSGVEIKDENTLITIGEVKTSVIGTYTVRYIVIDENGNLNSTIREVKVIQATTLQNKILTQNVLVEKEPNLKTTSQEAGENGLYKSTNTNDSSPTYYFRGAVENNYVEFAGFLWRIIRINEDGSIRLIMQDGIDNNTKYSFYPDSHDQYTYMYYSNTNLENGAMKILEDWYKKNIEDKGYNNQIVVGNYCEQAKATYDTHWVINNNTNMALYTDYISNFKCAEDANGKGPLKLEIGLISYDEVVHAGGYPKNNSTDYYLHHYLAFFTMSPAGFSSSDGSFLHTVFYNGELNFTSTNGTTALRPVINLNSNIKAIGLGTSEYPYKIID